jgi:hypothetical protein
MIPKHLHARLFWVLICLALFFEAQAQPILLLGRDTNDKFLSGFWSQNNNASNLVAGVTANHGSTRFGTNVIDWAAARDILNGLLEVDIMLAAKADSTNTAMFVSAASDPGAGRVGSELIHINSASGAIWMWDGDSWLAIRDADPIPTVATPTFSPVTGTTFATTLSLSMSCATVGASIYYTIDGSTPDTNDVLYSSAITLTNTTTVKAIGILEDYTDSGIRTGTYTYVPLSAVYWGKSASATLDSAGIMGLSSTNPASAAGSYTYTTDAGYSYFATPASWDTPTSLKIGSLDVSLKMSSPYDTAFGTLYCMIVEVDGVNYRVFRTYNSTSAGWIMTVE